MGKLFIDKVKNREATEEEIMDYCNKVLSRLNLKEENGCDATEETLELLICVDCLWEMKGTNFDKIEEEIPDEMRDIHISDIPVAACRQCIEPMKEVTQKLIDAYELYAENKNELTYKQLKEKLYSWQKMEGFISEKLMDYGDWILSKDYPEWHKYFGEHDELSFEEAMKVYIEGMNFFLEKTEEALEDYDQAMCMALFPSMDMLGLSLDTMLRREGEKYEKKEDRC